MKAEKKCCVTQKRRNSTARKVGKYDGMLLLESCLQRIFMKISNQSPFFVRTSLSFLSC